MNTFNTHTQKRISIMPLQREKQRRHFTPTSLSVALRRRTTTFLAVFSLMLAEYWNWSNCGAFSLRLMVMVTFVTALSKGYATSYA